MAGRDPITIFTGEDVIVPFTIDPVEDVSGWTLLFTVRDSAGAELFTKTGTVTSGGDGEMEVVLTDTETDGLEVAHHLYDFWRTDDGLERVLAIGDFRVKEVARSL